MGQVLEAELVIKGSDKTGSMFAGVIKHVEETKKAFAGLSNTALNDPKIKQMTRDLRTQSSVLRAQNSAWRAINESVALGNRELEARAGLMKRMTASVHKIAHLGGMGWMVGGMASGAFTHRTAHDAAEFAHQRAALAIGGMNPAEVKEAVGRAYQMRVPGMSAADNLRSIGELRMVFGSTAEALEHVGSVQRAAAALKAINPSMNGESESYNLARALELKGVSNDPAHFNRLNNMMVQAINATHGKVNAEEFMAFTQYAGSGTARTLSDEFYTRVAPTLIQEMHGNTAGRALATLRRQLVGGHMQVSAATEWMKLGLLDRHRVEFDKIGHVKKVHPGALVGSEEFVSDPYAWIHKYLTPALKRRGITDEKQVAIELANLFSDRYAENMATILLTQKQRIEKDRGLIAGAPGTESAEYAKTHDPIAAANDLAASVNTLLAAFGSPLAKPAIEGMTKLSDWMHDLGGIFGQFARKHPFRAAGVSGFGALSAGYVGFKGFQALWGLGTAGPALNASAAALDGSAAALDAAAAKLAAGGQLPGVLPSTSVPPSGRWSYWGPAARLLPAWLGGAVSIATTPDILKTAPDGRDWAEVIRERALIANEHVGSGGPPPLKLLDLSGAKAKAELTGPADVKVQVEVKPESGFWASVMSKITNGIAHINVTASGGGSTGSNGTTMPEVNPHPTIHHLH